MKARIAFSILILSMTACMGPEAKSKAAGEHYTQGMALLAKGDPRGAVAEFRKAVRLKPEDPTYHFMLGAAMEQTHTEQPDDVLAEYREAVRLKPDYADAHWSIAAILEMKGDVDGAIREYREAVRLKPDLPQLHYQLGDALRRKGDPNEALLEKLKARELEADALLVKGDFDGAIHGYNWMLAQVDEGRFHGRLDHEMEGKENSEAHAKIGAALEKKGNLDGAIHEYQLAVLSNPLNADAHSSYAAALDRKGDHEEAKYQAQCAENMSNDFSAAES